MTIDRTPCGTEHDLRERVKELTCLYGIAQLATRPGISQEEILQGIAQLLPPGWHYPEITCGRIVLDDQTYASDGFTEGAQRQTADIVVHGKRRGAVEVFYTQEMPLLDEGPFMKEERSLINAVAGHLALVLERLEAEEDRFRLQTEVRRADRLASIGQLAAGVAHELNNPLTAVLTYGHLLRRKTEEGDPSRPGLDTIIEAGERCRDIVRDLLDFARRRAPARQNTDVNKLVQHVLDMIANQMLIRRVTPVTELAETLPPAWIDGHEMGQVFINICINGIEAMDEGGQLTVSTRHVPSRDTICIAIADTGSGIAPRDIERIFDPFFTTKEVGKGTGLGLAVSQRIVTDNNGTIAVERLAGKGTVFAVELPVAVSGSEDT